MTRPIDIYALTIASEKSNGRRWRCQTACGSALVARQLVLRVMDSNGSEAAPEGPGGSFLPHLFSRLWFWVEKKASRQEPLFARVTHASQRTSTAAHCTGTAGPFRRSHALKFLHVRARSSTCGSGAAHPAVNQSQKALSPPPILEVTC